MQIILFVGLLELFSESDYILKKSNMKHYMAGGKPGPRERSGTLLGYRLSCFSNGNDARNLML